MQKEKKWERSNGVQVCKGIKPNQYFYPLTSRPIKTKTDEDKKKENMYISNLINPIHPFIFPTLKPFPSLPLSLKHKTHSPQQQPYTPSPTPHY